MIQAPATPATTQAHIPPLCNNSKAILWVYNVVYILGKKYECPPVADKNITNIAWTNNMTRSGRIFCPPPPPPKETNGDALDKARGKQVINNQPGPSVGREAE